MAAWAGLGYYARARNLIACARAVAGEHGGVFPDTEEGLRALPGVGPYTAAAIAAIAFDRPANVVDGNVERVMARLFAVETPLPDAKPELKRLAGGAGDGRAPRRLGPGADGSRRDHLPAAPAAVRALSPGGGLRGAGRRGAADLSEEGGEGRAAEAARRGLRADVGRRGGPGAPAVQGPARRHAGPADQRLGQGAAPAQRRPGRRAGGRRLAPGWARSSTSSPTFP